MGNEIAELEAWLARLDVPAKIEGMTSGEIASGLSGLLGRKCSVEYARRMIQRGIEAGLLEHAGERAARRSDGRRCWLPVYRSKLKGRRRGAK